MEELINGETPPELAALESRAADLARYLDVEGEDLDAPAIGALAYDTWLLPQVEALHGRLLAEVEVAGVEADPVEPNVQVYWSGIADAVATGDDGSITTVIDWKSDWNPSNEVLEHYQDQLRAYLRLTGAREGLLVLSALGKVVPVSPN